MILDVAARSLKSTKVLIPVEQLLGDCAGSRLPEVDPAQLSSVAAIAAVMACPTSALKLEESATGSQLVLDYGECIGCGACVGASPKAFVPARRLALCGASRSGLVRRWDVATGTELPADDPISVGIGNEIRALMGRALNIREVDAGSCNGCEGEIVALNGPHYDLERFGIHFVASPKHADMLLVTGPVTRNMTEALRRTYEATPSPKLVVAVGACGCSGGLFNGSYAVTGGVAAVIPVDGFVPGCPPTPAMLLTGILRVLDSQAARRI